MSINKVFLSETTLDNIETLALMFRIATEDKNNKHIWNISNNSIAWEDYNSFHTYLNNDFGNYHLYIAYKDRMMLGVFGMLNLSDCAQCANILIWADNSVRKSLLLMRWFILFLHEAQKKQVNQWYAKIKLANTVSLNSSKRYGFTQCDLMPRHLLETNRDNEEVSCVTRNTSFNNFERKYLKRYLPNIFEDYYGNCNRTKNE